MPLQPHRWPRPRPKEAALAPPPSNCDRERPKSVGHETPGRELLFSRVLCRRLLDHGRDHAVVAGVPVGRDLPVLAVPGLNAAQARALVISTGHFDRLQLVLEAELLEPLRSQVEVFESPSDLLAGHRLLTELLLRRADRLDAEHGVDEAADV